MGDSQQWPKSGPPDQPSLEDFLEGPALHELDLTRAADHGRDGVGVPKQ